MKCVICKKIRTWWDTLFSHNILLCTKCYKKSEYLILKEQIDRYHAYDLADDMRKVDEFKERLKK